MTFQRYVNKAFRPEAVARIHHCNVIIDRYQKQNLRLTLRQLYYQLVSRNVITNEEKSYKTLGKLVSDARLAGLMSWDAIEDRIRTPVVPQQFNDLAHLAEAASRAYRLPRWDGQQNYIELWVEKDALAGVLAPIAREYHITLMVNRGYSSTSAMYESAKRFLDAEEGDGRPNSSKDLHLLYLGDHDPSGEDMVRDVRDRLRTFDAVVDVQKVALTMEQIDEYSPPPNPAKVSDSRAAKYIELHGDSSWEVDALPPEVLTELIVEKIQELLDRPTMDRIMEREELDKKKLKKLVAGI